ncbi:hypothetical protein M405DRAFT_870366 [Rhizopogon salebrosus TDB-379]|nr:hypothetical protein M405DRAFT_870366 [Rhizopogon salebrosus TDB-379]
MCLSELHAPSQKDDKIVATQAGDLVVVNDRDSRLAKESLCHLFVGPYGYRVFTAGARCLSDMMNMHGCVVSDPDNSDVVRKVLRVSAKITLRFAFTANA